MKTKSIKPPKPERKPTGRLTTAILVVAAVVIFISIIADDLLIGPWKEGQAVIALRQMGASCGYETTGDWPVRWQQTALGKDVSNHVVTVTLRDCQHSDVALSHLADLPNLRILMLSGSNVADDDLALIQGLAELEMLRLTDTAVTDAGLIHLTKLRRLNSLELTGTQVSDAGMAYLAELSGLRFLSVRETQISDQSIEHFKRMSSLRVLVVDGTQITAEGAAELQRALPRVSIRYTSKAGAVITQSNLKAREPQYSSSSETPGK